MIQLCPRLLAVNYLIHTGDRRQQQVERRILHALRDRGLVLLSVSNDVRMKDVRGFAEEHAVPFPIFYDSLRELNDRLQMPWIPGTVVIDRSGAVVDRLYGEQDWQSEALLARLENHLLPQQNPGKEKR